MASMDDKTARHRALPVVPWLLWGTQLGLCVSGAALDLLWELPVTFYAWLYVLFLAPIVLVVNLVQMTVGLLVSFAVGCMVWWARDARALARSAGLASGVCFGGALMIGSPGFVPMAIALSQSPKDPASVLGPLIGSLALVSLMSWELWVPALAWMGVALVAWLGPGVHLIAACLQLLATLLALAVYGLVGSGYAALALTGAAPAAFGACLVSLSALGWFTRKA